MSDEFVVPVVVAGVAGYGPDLFFVKVVTNQKQYDNGDHYEAAKKWVSEELGVDEVSWACDDKDPAREIFKSFMWNTASIIKVDQFVAS